MLGFLDDNTTSFHVLLLESINVGMNNTCIAITTVI
jgi:hypothetical protein